MREMLRPEAEYDLPPALPHGPGLDVLLGVYWTNMYSLSVNVEPARAPLRVSTVNA